MVTHSTKAASHAKRVLFIKDGEVFHQLYRGNMKKEELYAKMLGCINSPASGIANSVNAVMSSLVRAVAAVRDQKSAQDYKTKRITTQIRIKEKNNEY